MCMRPARRWTWLRRCTWSSSRNIVRPWRRISCSRSRWFSSSRCSSKCRWWVTHLWWHPWWIPNRWWWTLTIRWPCNSNKCFNKCKPCRWWIHKWWWPLCNCQCKLPCKMRWWWVLTTIIWIVNLLCFSSSKSNKRETSINMLKIATSAVTILFTNTRKTKRRPREGETSKKMMILKCPKTEDKKWAVSTVDPHRGNLRMIQLKCLIPVNPLKKTKRCIRICLGQTLKITLGVKIQFSKGKRRRN